MSEPIKIDDETFSALAVRIASYERDVANLVNGVKLALKVPQNYALDMKQKAFVEPPVEPAPEKKE